MDRDVEAPPLGMMCFVCRDDCRVCDGGAGRARIERWSCRWSEHVEGPQKALAATTDVAHMHTNSRNRCLILVLGSDLRWRTSREMEFGWPQKIATSAWSRPAPAKKILTGFLASFSQKQRTMAPLHGLTVISLLIFAPFGVSAFSVVDVASTGPRVAPFVALSAISTRRKMPSRNPRHGKDVVERVESIQQFKDVVINEPKRITVVRFFASYCKSCQASAPLFYKLAFRYAKHDSPLARNVKFVEVPLTKQTKLLHEALGIPSLPFSHIYHPDAGLCEELAVSKKHIADVDECLRCYVFGECQLPDDPNSCMEVYGECDLDDGSWE